MPNFVAIDAGGTSTRCWVADATRVLGRATTGSVKLMTVGEEVATSRLWELVQTAAKEARIDLNTIQRTCIGIAGSSSATVRAWAQATLRGVLSGDILVCGDEEIALDAAFHDGPGILIIAGTGSNTVGRCADGTTVSAGGWGPILGDEGSGSWIGLEAIRAGLRAHDRAIETCLLREIESFWNLQDLGELVAKSNQRTRPDFSELTTVVAACAEGGDTLAASVLERAGEELATQVRLVASKMQAANCHASDANQIAFTGSVLAKVPRVRRSMEEHLLTAMPTATVAQTPVEPLEGALWKARQT